MMSFFKRKTWNVQFYGWYTDPIIRVKAFTEWGARFAAMCATAEKNYMGIKSATKVPADSEVPKQVGVIHL